MMRFLSSLSPFGVKIWAALLGSAGVLGVFAAGYGIGNSNLNDEISKLDRMSRIEIESIRDTSKNEIQRTLRETGLKIQSIQLEAREKIIKTKEELNSNIVVIKNEQANNTKKIIRTHDRVISGLTKEHHKELELAIANAVQTAKAEVRGEQQSNAKQLEQLAMLIAILRNTEIADRLNNETKEIVEKTAATVPDLAIKNATKNLPSGALSIGKPNCAKSGEIVSIEVGSFVDQCESKALIVIHSAYNAGPSPFVELSLNGSRQRLNVGQILKLSNACKAAFLQFMKSDRRWKPMLRFSCT